MRKYDNQIQFNRHNKEPKAKMTIELKAELEAKYNEYKKKYNAELEKWLKANDIKMTTT